MALWVNERIAGRAFLRMAYFTPTVLPMIAVANIWLFFYTPQYGLLEQITGALGLPSHNWLGRPVARRWPAVTLVAVWKEAGFFMIFYLAALQTLNPSLREAAAIEGASRWYFFRRVQWPLLMPTTLFVLVNAFINAFRMVDHLFVLTRGGPDNASTLLLYHLYEVGFSSGTRPMPRRSRWCWWWCWPASRCSSSSCSTSGCTTNEHAPTQRLAYNEPTWLDTLAAWLLALLWILPLVYAVWTAFHPGRVLDALRAARAAHARQLPPRLGGRAVRALLPQHHAAGG